MTYPPQPPHEPHPNHDRGLEFDLSTLMSRRSLGMFLGAGTAAALAACTPGGSATGAASATATAGPAAASFGTAAASGTPSASASPTLTRAIAECGVEIPAETAGPYPGDGSNGANVLTESGVVRSDTTSSFGSSTTMAEGIPLTVTMTINDFSENKSPLAGGAVYLWHCNRDGQYSLYSQPIAGENYLRGVQETDDKGQVKFTTILPACYDGRWPNIHFVVYPSLAKATNSANKIATSQMALPEDIVKVAYATAGYEQSVTNLSKVTLAGDNVFGDGYDLQIPTVTGDPTTGYTLKFTCAV